MWFKQMTVQTNRKTESKFRCVGKYHLPYFIINTKQSLVYEKLKIVPSCDSYLYAIYSMNYLLCIYFMLNAFFQGEV